MATVRLDEPQWRGTNGALDNVGVVAAQNGQDELAQECLSLRGAGDAWVDAHGYPVQLDLTQGQLEIILAALDETLAFAVLLGQQDSVAVLEAARSALSEGPPSTTP